MEVPPMTRTEAIKEFFKKAVLPVAMPFGIHRMCVWIVPGGGSLGGGAALFVLNFVIGGLIGGFILVWRLLVAAWYVPLTIYRIAVVK